MWLFCPYPSVILLWSTPGAYVLVHHTPLFLLILVITLRLSYHAFQSSLLNISLLTCSSLLTAVSLYDDLVLGTSILRVELNHISRLVDNLLQSLDRWPVKSLEGFETVTIGSRTLNPRPPGLRALNPSRLML